jgi:hypothetical protein
MSFHYEIVSVDYEKKEISFKLSNDVLCTINMCQKYPGYYLKHKQLYWDNYNEEIVKLLHTDRVVVKYEHMVFTRATQFQIDRSEEKYNSDNWKVYCHLKDVFLKTSLDY